MCNLAITFLCSLHLSIGLAIHPLYYDAPEITGLNNPLGVIVMEYDYNDKLSLYMEHVSGVTTTEAGFGFNMIGIKLKVF